MDQDFTRKKLTKGALPKRSDNASSDKISCSPALPLNQVIPSASSSRDCAQFLVVQLNPVISRRDTGATIHFLLTLLRTSRTSNHTSEALRQPNIKYKAEMSSPRRRIETDRLGTYEADITQVDERL
ncbi:hypothetical protein BUE80_DR006091 [Diplocarpon rosae]|nr:hypothetical protein BUE80_DR006091 [Diplocarpon rosae]